MGHRWYKVAVTFECGHSKTYEVYSLAEAAQYEAQGTRQQCGDCIMSTWAHLTGTPRQIALASRIRRSMAQMTANVPLATEGRAAWWIKTWEENHGTF